MTTKNHNTHAVFECTRLTTVELQKGVPCERFVQLLNDRQVALKGDVLVEGYTGEVLGRRVLSVNTSDYKVGDRANTYPEFDTLDPYHFEYNNI
jgi:hypothetical protein